MNGYTDLTTNIENSRNCLRRIARHDDQEFSNQSILNVMEKFVKTVNAMDETILVPCRLMDRQVGDSQDTVPLPSSNTLTNSQNNNTNSKYQQYGKNKKKNATVRDYLNSSDLFILYNMLNNVKVDLLWGRNNVDENDNDEDDQGVDTTYTSAVSSSSSSATVTATPVSNTTLLNTTTAATDEQQQTNESKTSTNNNSNETGVKGHTRRPSTVSITSSNSISTLSDDSESEISNENDSGIESEGNHEHDKSVELSKQFRSHLLGLYKCLEQMTDTANYLTARYQSDVGGNV